MNPIEEKLQRLARLRADLETAKENYETLHDRFIKNAMDVIEEHNRIKLEVEALESSIRMEAIHKHQASGLKEFPGGVRIRNVKHIAITDMDAALEWGYKHRIGLVPDVKKLKDLSKVHSDMPFIEVTERPQATIPKDIVILEEST